MRGVYVHIPFCKKKCAYCNFYSVCDISITEDYQKTLLKEIDRWGADTDIDTLYIGGGTPSFFGCEKICELVKKVNPSGEVTVEVNPKTIDINGFRMLKEGGVNRISIGVQSFNNNELKTLGRIHDGKEAIECIQNAKKAGFDNISCDLIICVQGQTKESLRKNIEKLIELEIPHISSYILEYNQETPIYNTVSTRYNSDVEAEMYLFLCNILEESGYIHYEISSFAKKGYESRHNLKYWNLDEYLGIGSKAHSLINGERFYCASDAYEFSKNIVNYEKIENCDYDFERIMLGLRTNKGIENTFDEKIINKLIDEKLIKISENKITLTNKGFLVSNSIINMLVK